MRLLVIWLDWDQICGESVDPETICVLLILRERQRVFNTRKMVQCGRAQIVICSIVLSGCQSWPLSVIAHPRSQVTGAH